MLEKAYGIRAMKKSQIYEWYRRFKNGQESVNDEKRNGRPASVISRHVTEIRQLLELNRREISCKVDCNIGTVHDILHNKLNMKRVCARWIPKMSEDQEKQRIECCRRQVDRFERDSYEFFRRIITVVKTRISLYEPETKEQSAMWKTPGSPSPKKFKVSPSKKKQKFIVFFDAEGVILSHAVPHGQTITAQYYSKVKQLKYLCTLSL